MKSLPQWFIIC